MASQECARGGGVNHILAEKRGVSFTFFLKMHENAIFSLKTGGGGRTPATPYAGSATAVLPLFSNPGSALALHLKHIGIGYIWTYLESPNILAFLKKY